ncbi:type II toxin-antitoxin system PemK/MazF family toxin [Companilactobacillus mishanensis]|uniref:Type II toxin-antitoxin system PemK/MazF family toxin n=1 Tax=Companilactobacillus mishanensis TaxID=2486008 RepID=A0A5P0ZK50_9LACO|nr:type II toxin-antitoxin system PemK/MazF family toxin [Companilactobacillus mishanensis]MQS53444.1 type II toxin-antitoxin system PemK/MazF family toxin [Companilactobacillus mishanensis]
MSYTPAQGDIIWIDFDPTRGHEIKKRRPALIVSGNDYNRATNFIIVCPITHTIRSIPSYFNLTGYKTEGQVVTQQLYSLDSTDKGTRNPQFIEKLDPPDFMGIAQLISFNFNFNDFN